MNLERSGIMTCRVCGETLSGEYFYPKTLGLGRICRDCNSRRVAAWNAAHPERRRRVRREAERRRYADPCKRQDIKLQHRLYYLRHAERLRQAQREYYYRKKEVCRGHHRNDAESEAEAGEADDE